MAGFLKRIKVFAAFFALIVLVASGKSRYVNPKMHVFVVDLINL